MSLEFARQGPGLRNPGPFSKAANDKRPLLRLSGACEGKGTMLRITKVDTPSEQKLMLEGRLTEPWIADLSSHWVKTRHAHPERKFVVDLRGVMRIDSAGKSALDLMKTEGAEFLASGIRMKHLVKDLEIEDAAKKPQYGRTVGQCMWTEVAEK
jgi:ABC-type transporter Mla MlaB component